MDQRTRFRCLSQMPIVNVNADVSSGTRGIFFGLSLPLHSYLVYASNEGYGESVHAIETTSGIGVTLQ